MADQAEQRGAQRRKHFGWRHRHVAVALPSPIYTPSEFRQLIDMECVRADRYRTRFSLAVFELGTSDENSVLMRRLVRTLHHRFRNTDDLGWYTRHQIGVIMPFTPREGAWRLGEYICQTIATVTTPPAFSIYTYPSENWPAATPLQRIVGRFDPAALIQRWFFPRTPSAAAFHALIARERGRSDRNGNVFSLVIFRLDLDSAHTMQARRLVAALGRRLRDTDEIGWFDGQHIGAILPYVSGGDAAKIAESICREVQIPAQGTYTVYTYPKSWFPSGTAA